MAFAGSQIVSNDFGEPVTLVGGSNRDSEADPPDDSVTKKMVGHYGLSARLTHPTSKIHRLEATAVEESTAATRLF